MTKEVKLDGPSSLPPPVTPKTVTKKYPIQGPGAQEAAVKLKAQLAAARPGKAGGPGKSLVDPSAVKAAQLQQAQQTRNASGVVNAQEVSAQQTAKGSLGTEVSAKITLPPGQFGKPDPKLLASAAQKLGTAQARLANTFNDPAKTLEELMETNTGQHFTDAELAVLLLDVDHTERKLDEELSAASSTLDVAQAQLKVEQTKIDNSFDKMGHLVDAMDNMEAGLQDLLKGNKDLKGAVNDLREGIAETRATKAERAVDLNTKAQLDLTGSADQPEVAQALLSAVPKQATPPLTPTQLQAQLQAAVGTADANVKAQEAKTPQDAVELKKAKAGQANATRQRDFGAAASTRPMTADARMQMRKIVAIEQKESDEHDSALGRPAKDIKQKDAEQDDKDLACERATARAMLANHLGVLLDATFHDSTASKGESRDLQNQLDTQLKRIEKDYGSLPAASVQDQITANRSAYAPTGGAKGWLAPGQSPITPTSKLQAALTKLQAERPALVIRRNQAVAEYRAMAEQSAYTRLRMLDPPVPESGARAAAVAHAVDVTTKLTSKTAQALDEKKLALADLEVKGATGGLTPAQTAAADSLKSEIGALEATREQEKTFAARQAKVLYGYDDAKGHHGGAIENMTTYLADKRIDGHEFTRVAEASTAAFRKFDHAVQSGGNVSQAIRDVDLAVGGVRDANEHTQLDNELKERGENVQKNGLSVADQNKVRAYHAACLGAFHSAEAEGDAAEHDVNAQKTQLALLNGKTPAASKAEVDAQTKVVANAEERWQIAKDNVVTMTQAHDFVTRSGASAAKPDDMRKYLDAVGVPEKAGDKLPNSVLGVRARILALQKPTVAPGAIAESRDDLLRTLHMQQGTAQLYNDNNARLGAAWSGTPVAVKADWLKGDENIKLDSYAGMQAALVKQDHAPEIVPAKFAIAVPPGADRTQFYNAQLDVLYAKISDDQKPLDDKKKPMSAAAARDKALAEDGKTGFSAPKDPKDDTASNFVKAARLAYLHQQIDPQIESARLHHDTGWRPVEVQAFVLAQDSLQAATDKWYGNNQPAPQPGQPPTASFADKSGALPTLDDLIPVDSDKAKVAQAYFQAGDAIARAQVDGIKNAKTAQNESNAVNADRAPEVEKAISARQVARDAYAKASQALAHAQTPPSETDKQNQNIQANTKNEIEKANRVIEGADLHTESAAPHFAATPDTYGTVKKIFEMGSSLASLANQTNFYRFAERNRKAVTADANELWQKAENVVGSARSALLHATDRDAGARESVFQVLQQLVEDAAKGRG